MTTTTNPRDYVPTRDALDAARKALAGSRTLSADRALRAKMIEHFGAERVAKVDVETHTYEADLEVKIAELIPLVDALRKIACPRCLGTGNYMAPTSRRTRDGRPVCFKCNGSGRA